MPALVQAPSDGGAEGRLADAGGADEQHGPAAAGGEPGDEGVDELRLGFGRPLHRPSMAV